MPSAAKVNLLDFDRAALEEFFVELGEKPFRARQLMQWIHQRGVTDFEQMTDISKPLRARLAECSGVEMPRVLEVQNSSDGTRK